MISNNLNNIDKTFTQYKYKQNVVERFSNQHQKQFETGNRSVDIVLECFQKLTGMQMSCTSWSRLKAFGVNLDT